MNRRAHEETNRRLNRRGCKEVWAAIAIDECNMGEEASSGLLMRISRWMLGMILLPFCWVTTWTFLSRFSQVSIEQGFWLGMEFWYFATGVLVMLGWFWSRLGQSMFLYVYVLGHELTHAAFVKCFRGKVLDIHWSSVGGYVTTDKTNWVIALSPYFIPFWSTMVVIIYVAVSLFLNPTPLINQIFYAAIGASWAFHLAWTLWMIPRDQPDLKDNGTFLSLVLIYFGNLIVLIALLCFAAPSPLESFRDFGFSWFGTAITWSDSSLRWLHGFIENLGVAQADL
ncbi:MAG: hypothetical protein H7Y36_12710 [Armatimonadetes bacterium]|nr:hypothetical protein [Akkermansiaceae bacterium]